VRAGPPPGATRSQLAEQNDLYASAIAARERGDSAAAIALFERLVLKYPAAPLAESAWAERMKIFATTDPRRAIDAAREYLARYPVGFARADAETILSRETSGH
jgi:outer membrane protein assembly factor BamD (BamD/ComL family)